MKEFRFNCPSCGQHILASEDGIGREVNCPSCKTGITIPPPLKEQNGTEASEQRINLVGTSAVSDHGSSTLPPPSPSAEKGPLPAEPHQRTTTEEQEQVLRKKGRRQRKRLDIELSHTFSPKFLDDADQRIAVVRDARTLSGARKGPLVGRRQTGLVTVSERCVNRSRGVKASQNRRLIRPSSRRSICA